jgi:hypothetical protein
MDSWLGEYHGDSWSSRRCDTSGQVFVGDLKSSMLLWQPVEELLGEVEVVETGYAAVGFDEGPHDVPAYEHGYEGFEVLPFRGINGPEI